MAKSVYKLNYECFAHSSDVRGLAVTPDDNGSFASVSRDKTAIYWTNKDGQYELQVAKTEHTNFISSVCITRPNPKFPKGLVITGSNDSHICIWNPSDNELLHKFKAHENTVCCLNASRAQENAFVSSSWDITAKIWNLNNLSKPEVTFIGHSASVWCTLDLPNGLVVTGSADKLIIVYRRNGQILRKIEAHKDCIRDLAIINNDQVLSCSNDAVIKLWNVTTGECLGEFYGHTNFIYSMSAIADGSLVASSGEDKSIRVWSNGELEQTISLPAQSIWCVKILPNTDIVCGASDGAIRIFTADPRRYADTETMKAYELSVAKESAESAIGDMKVKDLPNPSILAAPGKTDGEIKVVNESNIPKAYSWSQKDMKWNLIGDVVGGTPKNSGKQLYNGMEYDYVFSVDIQDGVPPLKLPYNKGQDPYFVAQKFIHDNNLDQQFLEQVATFIMKNSENAPVESNPTQFYDPFTGGSRYIPQGTSQGTPAPDPFTGGSRYIPQGGSTTLPTPTALIPRKDYLKLEQANLNTILEKLKGFNSSQEVGLQSIPNDHMEFVVQLVTDDCQEVIDAGIVDVLLSLLSWPHSIVFPVLDVARLAVLQRRVNTAICNDKLINLIVPHLSKDALESNQMLTFRLLSNMFCHSAGERLNLKYKDEILKGITTLPTFRGKNNQVAISSYLMNLAIAFNRTHDVSSKSQYINVLSTILPLVTESEALFRILVGLGTLLLESSTNLSLRDLLKESTNTVSILTKATESKESKVVEVSKKILELLV